MNLSFSIHLIFRFAQRLTGAYFMTLFLLLSALICFPIHSFSQDAAAEVEDYIYDPIGRRDPFKPWRPFTIKKAVVPDGTTSAAKVIEITDPLQKHEIEQYEILGIMWDVSRPRALIKDPENKTHMVFQGTRLGRNGGVIQTMREGEVVVTENIDVNGELKQTTKLLEVKARQLSGGVVTPAKKATLPPSPVMQKNINENNK